MKSKKFWPKKERRVTERQRMGREMKDHPKKAADPSPVHHSARVEVDAETIAPQSHLDCAHHDHTLGLRMNSNKETKGLVTRWHSQVLVRKMMPSSSQCPSNGQQHYQMETVR